MFDSGQKKRSSTPPLTQTYVYSFNSRFYSNAGLLGFSTVLCNEFLLKLWKNELFVVSVITLFSGGCSDFSIHLKIKNINPLNAELNPIRHLLAFVGARHIVHVSRRRVNMHFVPYREKRGASRLKYK